MRREAVAAVLAWITLMPHFPARAAAADLDPPVVVYQNSNLYALYNGHVTATISKASGEIVSLRFEGRELLADADRRAPGSWFNALSSDAATDRIVIDPSGNQGARGEVSIGAGGSLAIDIRYSLGRGDHGLYACQILSHPANSPLARVSSGGFQLRLNEKLFDYLTVSKARGHAIPSAQDWIAAKPIVSTEARRMVSGKFTGQLVCFWDDAATQMETPVYGFSGAQAGVGLWIINPSCDYLSRGGNVVEPTGWLDSLDGAPTLTNRWGGEPMPQAGISVNRGESWSHVIGPFLLYCNQGSFQDAQFQGRQEKSQWPYAWAGRDEAVPSRQRAAVCGQIVLSQSPLASTLYPATPPLAAQPASIWQNPYGPQAPAPGDVPTTQPQALEQLHGAMIGLSSDEDWQTNFFDDQVWIRAGDDGTFSIANVLPGTYTLHVYCDGQVGEASVGGVRLDPGRTVDLGKVVWTPRPYGQFVWQLGYPDRSAAKFRHGDDATRWGKWTLDRKEFPAGVNYLIGKGDPRKDWNYAQFPGTTWAIHFPLGFVPDSGCGFLHVALAGGSGAARLSVILNGNDISQSVFLPNPTVSRPPGSVLVDDIAHDQVRGLYRESVYSFSPADIQIGDNVLLLRVDGRKATDGLMYDCLRMEIRADSFLLPGEGDAGFAVPQMILVNPKGPRLRVTATYRGDPSGDYTGIDHPR
ncbi:MAG: polysaccharide lyase family protein [Tepidisphaeraceae bacterium]